MKSIIGPITYIPKRIIKPKTGEKISKKSINLKKSDVSFEILLNIFLNNLTNNINYDLFLLK